jgi:8-hydroxy-5-deazaflavin:NADPH oxidoreductase
MAMSNSTQSGKKIGVIGTGAMGSAFARLLRRHGYTVTIANSRGAEGVRALERELGARGGSVWDAVRDVELVLLSIPTKAMTSLPPDLFKDVAESSVVVDVANYHPELRDGRIDAIEGGMLESQWVSAQIGRSVVKAFNSIEVESLLTRSAPRGANGRIALPVAGNSVEDKARVLRIVDELGFDAVDAGDLDNSWRQQTGAPAYCKDLGAGALRRALAQADRSQIAKYRKEREAHLRQLSSARA